MSIKLRSTLGTAANSPGRLSKARWRNSSAGPHQVERLAAAFPIFDVRADVRNRPIADIGADGQSSAMRRLLDALFAPWLVTILVLFVLGSLVAFALEASGWCEPDYRRLLFAMVL